MSLLLPWLARNYHFIGANSLSHYFILCCTCIVNLRETKVPKNSPKGNPLGYPRLTGATQSAHFSIDRHTLEENIQRMPRCRYIAVIGALFRCFEVPGASLYCTEVCRTLGQRQLLSILVTDGLRAGRPGVLRSFYRQSSFRFGIGDLR